jgi:adenylate cyclase
MHLSQSRVARQIYPRRRRPVDPSGCGMVLFAYLLSHFVNHAFGNISLDALATGVRYHTAFWKSFPIATVFYAAAATHAGRGICALYQRRQFHWKAIEPTTCTRFKYPRPYHHPSCRRAA